MTGTVSQPISLTIHTQRPQAETAANPHWYRAGMPFLELGEVLSGCRVEILSKQPFQGVLAEKRRGSSDQKTEPGRSHHLVSVPLFFSQGRWPQACLAIWLCQRKSWEEAGGQVGRENLSLLLTALTWAVSLLDSSCQASLLNSDFRHTTLTSAFGTLPSWLEVTASCRHPASSSCWCLSSTSTWVTYN